MLHGYQEVLKNKRHIFRNILNHILVKFVNYEEWGWEHLTKFDKKRKVKNKTKHKTKMKLGPAS